MNDKREATIVMLAAVGLVVCAFSALTPTEASAQEAKLIYACYMQSSGVVYRINPPDEPGQDPKLKDDCTGENHVKFYWVEFLSADGKVGIGVPEPTAELDVAGDIHASGKLIIGNTIEIDDATNSITSTSGTISFSDEDLVTSGTIQSASGGFKFPDGSIQTAAALAMTGATGEHSIAVGDGAEASGDYSTAIGQATTAIGIYSTAIGVATRAEGGISTALGSNTYAGEAHSMAWGDNAQANGEGATAIGNYTRAVGVNSTAMGTETEAVGDYSTAMGRETVASWDYATAMGFQTTASDHSSTAMGFRTTASGGWSTAMGNFTTASGNWSTAMGASTTASGEWSTAMGVSTTATGHYSTAMGVFTEASGQYSTAMGRYASTNMKDGSFVYGDASVADDYYVQSLMENSFTVRASGGFYLYTNPGLTAGVTLPSGGSGWDAVSDRNLKENFQQEDGERALAAIASMPIQTWNYKAQDPSIRHMGPMAQDFYAAFGLGTDDKHINTVDIDGVNMLAIQALEKRTSDLRTENQQLKARIADLEAAMLRLETALSGREN